MNAWGKAGGTRKLSRLALACGPLAISPFPYVPREFYVRLAGARAYMCGGFFALLLPLLHPRRRTQAQGFKATGLSCICVSQDLNEEIKVLFKNCL